MANEVNEMTAEAVRLKEEVESIKAALKEKKQELDAVESKILSTLELMGVDSLKAHGFTFFPERKSSVSVPKTRAEKELLFKFLEERGIFWEAVSVNSQTLNALYKNCEQEAAEKGSLDYRLPGVGEPTIYVTLKMRRN